MKFDFQDMKLLVSLEVEKQIKKTIMMLDRNWKLYMHKHRNSCQLQLEVRCLFRVQHKE